MRISDWSSDVCSSDLFRLFMIAILLCLAIIIILAGLRARKISPLSMLAKLFSHFAKAPPPLAHAPEGRRIYAIGDIHGHLDLLDGLLAQIFADERTGGVSGEQIGRASCRERVCQYGLIWVVAESLKKKETENFHLRIKDIQLSLSNK